MIYLSNGHSFEYLIASGALGFDGRGWFWERLLVKRGFMQPELATIAIRTLTRRPRLYPVANHSWIRPWTWLPFSPWSCARAFKGGWVNKVGLWNKGIDWWCREVAPTIDFKKYKIVGSIFGNEEELIEMAEMLNEHDLVALEVNPSCPNLKQALGSTDMVVRLVKAVKRVSRHPIIVKLSADQDCLEIARQLKGIAEAIDLNSVPWETAFPKGKRSPLWRLQKRVGFGGGGVSGKKAQEHNWPVVKMLARQGLIPVIASSIMKFKDLAHVRDNLGASAEAFGAIHLPSWPVWLMPWTLFTNPCKPTRFIRRELKYGRAQDSIPAA